MTPQFVWRPKPVSLETKQPATPESKGGRGEKRKNTCVSQQTYRLCPHNTPRVPYMSIGEGFLDIAKRSQHPGIHTQDTLSHPLSTKRKWHRSTGILSGSKIQNTQPIAQVNIAELLAWILWTENKVRQHIVNEVSQALHIILVFTNRAANPLQRWKHGTWMSSWEGEPEGRIYMYVVCKHLDSGNQSQIKKRTKHGMEKGTTSNKTTFSHTHHRPHHRLRRRPNHLATNG